MIEAHRTWMIAGGMARKTSVADACELLARVDRDLAKTEFGHQGLAGAYPEELAAWLADDAWSAQTKATYHSHLRRFYLWATDPDDPWLSYDPSARLRRPRVRRSIPNPASHAEVVTILARALSPWWLHCFLAAKVGLRPVEIAAARREDFTATHVRIPHGKGDKPAVLPLDPQVWAVVEPYPVGLLTRKIGGGAASAAWVSNNTSRHLHDHVGVAVTLRRLRSYFGTWLLDNGATMRETQELLRHESIETTAGYTAVTQARLRAVVATLPTFDVPGWVGRGGGPAAG